MTENLIWQGRALRVRWLELSFQPPPPQITQASGLCFTEVGQIVLVSQDSSSWNLPGGKPEPGETAEKALVREVWEEASAEVLDFEYLGCQEVIDPALSAPYYQTRFWARVRLESFIGAFETNQLCLVHPDDFLNTQSWGDSPVARRLLEQALKMM